MILDDIHASIDLQIACILQSLAQLLISGMQDYLPEYRIDFLVSSNMLFSFQKIKKKKKVEFLFISVYGRFLSISTINIAPITMMMTAMSAIPNSRLPADAKPVGGEAVGGAGVGAEPTYTCVSAEDP